MFHGNASPVAFSKQGSLCCLQCQHGADLRGASRRRRLPVHSLQRREHIRQLNPRALVIVMSPAAKWWHWGLGWISQTGYELINEILWKLILLWFWVWWFNQVRILHMPWQLSCHGMCKILTWSDCYFSPNSNPYVDEIWGMSSFTVCEMDPCFLHLLDNVMLRNFRATVA